MAYQSINLNTGKLVKSFEHLTHPQLETKPSAADACFQTWKHTRGLAMCANPIKP